MPQSKATTPQSTSTTPGQAEGTEADIDMALDTDPKRQHARVVDAQHRDQAQQRSGTTPGQAEGTEQQAEGSLRQQK